MLPSDCSNNANSTCSATMAARVRASWRNRQDASADYPTPAIHAAREAAVLARDICERLMTFYRTIIPHMKFEAYQRCRWTCFFAPKGTSSIQPE